LTTARPIRSARANAASLPHWYFAPSACSQICRPSGASMLVMWTRRP
jgi:hypothetical protein